MSLEMPEGLRWLGLVAGAEWPDGDEDKMWALAHAWQTAAHELNALIADIAKAKDVALAAYPAGKGSENAAAAFDKLLRGDSSVEHLATMFEQIGAAAEHAGTALQQTKLMIISSLSMLAWEIADAWLFPPTAPLVEAAAIGAARAFLYMVGRRLIAALEKVVPWLVKAADYAWRAVKFVLSLPIKLFEYAGTKAGAAVESALTKIGTREAIAAGGGQMAKGLISQSATAAVWAVDQDLLIQAIQVGQGHRRGIDWKEVGISAAASAGGAHLGNALGNGFGRAIELMNKSKGWDIAKNGVKGFGEGAGTPLMGKGIGKTDFGKGVAEIANRPGRFDLTHGVGGTFRGIVAGAAGGVGSTFGGNIIAAGITGDWSLTAGLAGNAFRSGGSGLVRGGVGERGAPPPRFDTHELQTFSAHPTRPVTPDGTRPTPPTRDSPRPSQESVNRNPLHTSRPEQATTNPHEQPTSGNDQPGNAGRDRMPTGEEPAPFTHDREVGSTTSDGQEGNAGAEHVPAPVGHDQIAPAAGDRTPGEPVERPISHEQNVNSGGDPIARAPDQGPAGVGENSPAGQGNIPRDPPPPTQEQVTSGHDGSAASGHEPTVNGRQDTPTGRDETSAGSHDQAPDSQGGTSSSDHPTIDHVAAAPEHDGTPAGGGDTPTVPARQEINGSEQASPIGHQQANPDHEGSSTTRPDGAATGHDGGHAGGVESPVASQRQENGEPGQVPSAGHDQRRPGDEETAGANGQAAAGQAAAPAAGASAASGSAAPSSSVGAPPPQSSDRATPGTAALAWKEFKEATGATRFETKVPTVADRMLGEHIDKYGAAVVRDIRDVPNQVVQRVENWLGSGQDAVRPTYRSRIAGEQREQFAELLRESGVDAPDERATLAGSGMKAKGRPKQDGEMDEMPGSYYIAAPDRSVWRGVDGSAGHPRSGIAPSGKEYR
ncbi:hypothetical protein [Nocardia sp. NPDC052566]|uniref:WXG100-like domain-containing protein n=1 Tax=Nocardia sp. NPDC052566 TaxID=3364330 RepID=UPI0037CB46F5